MMNTIVCKSRLWLSVGVSVVLGCCVSATWAFQTGLAGEDASPPARESAASPGVVCLGYVDLEPTVTSLCPLALGRVTEVLVHENDRVAAGTMLLRLEDTNAKLQVAEAQVALEKAQNRLDIARKLPEQQRLRLQQQRESAEAAEQRASAARAILARKEKLARIRQLGAEELDAAGDEVKQLEAAARAERAKLTELQLHDPAADVRQAELDVKSLTIHLAQARKAVDECALKAPRAGTVLRILAGPGDIIPRQPGEAAVQFAPEGRRLVRAEVDQEFVSRVKTGQSALVRDDSAAGTSWRGKVLRVADWYTQRRNLPYDPTQLRDTRTAECLIALDAGQPEPRLGQRVRVTIGGQL
jgi:multidrug resistance efflux pump